MSSEARPWPLRVALLCAFLLALFLARVGEPRLHAQSRINLKFLKSESLASAIDAYPKIWLPAYPVALYGAQRLGVPAKHFNLIALLGLLALAATFARRHASNVSPLAVLVLLVGSGAIYANVQHLVAETLFTLLAFAAMMLVVAQRERPNVFLTLALVATVAVASLTKHFGFLWLAPLVAVLLAAVFARRSAREAVAHVSLFVASSAALTLPWFFHVKAETGRFFAANRMVPRRGLPPKLAHWNDQIDFGTNVLFTVKTVLIDLFSPFRLAEHEVVEAAPYRVEGLVFAVVACALALILAGTVSALRRVGAPDRSGALELLLQPRVVPVVFLSSYLAALIAVWSFANNDPIYTRFLFPAYPFLFLSVLSAYSLVKERAASSWVRVPFFLLFAVYLGCNANRFALFALE